MNVYLDNNTVKQASKGVVAAMQPFLRERFGVPSAPHKLGQDLHNPMRSAYESIYELLGADEKATVVHTSSGTEAVNQVLQSVFVDVSRETGRNSFVTSSVDEAPAIMTIGRLEQLGGSGRMADVNSEGCVSADAIADCISARTALVSLSWANGLTGVINPVSEIAQICQQRGILLHLDVSHVAGQWPIELDEVPVDFLTFDGARLHGPRGSGALYIRPGLTLSPLIVGGADQAGFRAGAVDVASLVGLGQAASEAIGAMDHVAMETSRLRDKLETELMRIVPGAKVFFRDSERIPTTSVIGFPGVSNDALLYALAAQGVYACFGGGTLQRLGLVLEGSGIDPALANSALSFALSRDTTEQEIDQAVEVIERTVRELRDLSRSLVNVEQEV